MHTIRSRAALMLAALRHQVRPPVSPRHGERGQVLPIFAVMAVVLLGGAAMLTDVAWWWTNEQRMQRAADAGALAGAIYLPGNQGLAYATALAETAKNGYINGQGGVVITTRADTDDPRKLIVDIDGPVNTNFARVFAMTSIDVSVTGAASYVLPVPMGSPQNYYGVGFLRDAVTTTTLVPTDDDTGFNSPSGTLSGQWNNASGANSGGGGVASEATSGDVQTWGNFGLAQEIPNDASVEIEGLQVFLRDLDLTGSGGSTSGCRVEVEVSWGGGAAGTWSNIVNIGSLSTSATDRSAGSTSSTGAWGGRTWTRADFADGTFLVRLTWREAGSCSSGRSVELDELEVRVDYEWDEPQTTTTIQDAPVRSPDGDVLAPQNFWGALQSQGAPNIQGDAYMTYYNTRTSQTNADYQADGYYQYAIEFPAASSNGEIWLFDPGFCTVDSDKGTGEYYTTGGANGSTSFNDVSTFYDLYDTNNTPFDSTDDTLLYGSGNAFRNTRWRDTILDSNFSGLNPCDNLAWHNDWLRIANGLAGGRTYKLHTYSTDPNNANAQRNTTALNAFAIWSKASGGTPRVHGLGAMEAYVRLPGGRASEFYLAQIDAEHAGKTMVINLWDPGDTGSLSANLQILRPDTSDYVVTSFNYTARQNSGAASSCNSRSGTGVNSVTTNTGGSSLFNGCWVTIEIALPSDYRAPRPTSDTVATEGGWWKIRYNMGSGGGFSTDLTTWEVQLRGNPVHLVQE